MRAEPLIVIAFLFAWAYEVKTHHSTTEFFYKVGKIQEGVTISETNEFLAVKLGAENE